VPPIISKLLAGGLSAAVVLLWYPLFFPTDSVESWLIRGVVITLAYEILVQSLSPLERALWETSQAKQVRAGAARLARGDRTMRSRSFVAVCAITVPVALMAIAPPHQLSHNLAQRTAVRHVTEVKRVVKVERRTVAMAARPSTSGVESAAATPEAPATGNTRPVRRSTATTGTTKRADTKHTGDDATSDSSPATDGGGTGDSAATTTPAPAPTQSTDAQPTTDGADTTAQPRPRAVAPARIA
jgi:hypothetical protein